MAVLQMRKICICALKKDRKQILEQLQRSGVMEVSELLSEKEEQALEDGFRHMDTFAARTGFERSASVAENALEILDRHVPEKKGMFASLMGKRLVGLNQFLDIAQRRDEIIDDANKIIRLQKEITAVEADIAGLSAQLEAIVPWLEMDVEGMTTGTERTTFLYGYFPTKISQEELYRLIEKQEEFPKASEVRVFHSDKNQTCVAAFCMKKDAVKFEEALRKMGFSRPALIMRSVPEKSREKWTKRIEGYNEKKQALELEIKNMAVHRHEIQEVADYFRGRAEKYEVLGRLRQTKHTFFITGYIVARQEESLRKSLTDMYTVMIATEEIPADEEAPVILSNNGFVSPVEGIVESFGLPKKGEVDPSTVMAFFYYVLFGMMLSDAAYGFIMASACFVVLVKFPRMEESLKKSIKMFMYCGVSTMIWGILYGGYFGDAVTVVSRTFFGKEIVIKPLWFAPLDEPVRLLLYSIAIGVVHLYAGLAMKAYQLLKQGKVKDVLYDVVLWYMTITGLLLMLLPSNFFESISEMTIRFPLWVDVLAKVMVAVGLVGILLTSGRRKKNWALRIALGAYDIYGITSWLSDMLSYSRLLALGLATGVIASAVNLLGSMAGKSVMGVIVFIVVFILGHTLNIGINVLGAYVHTNRLQYIEFFGKYYEGGGKAFNPFKLNTKYIDIKED